jgi:glucosyl-dolichyl phosphate glucuronosyltransferase
MRIDVIIATFNRSTMLRECIESVLRSKSSVDWRVTVVDNNSSDDTRAVVESLATKNSRVRYLFEKKQGKCFALNLGITSSECDVIGMIDDDEQIHPDWIDKAVAWFEDPHVDFIGGPYLGLWRTPIPDWLPAGYEGVISARDPKELPDEPVRFPDERFFVQGGNAVLRRHVFDRVGLYRNDIGRFGNNFGSCEDLEMFNRLISAGLTGYFDPRLIIYHVVPPERMMRSYYRQWVFGQARSWAGLNKAAPQQTAYLGKIPRYMIGNALKKTPALLSPVPSRRFAAELEWWRVAGFIRGAYRAT